MLRLRLTVSHLLRGLAVRRLTGWRGRLAVAVVGWVGVHRRRRRNASSASVEGLMARRGSSVGLLLLGGLAVEGLLLGLAVGLRRGWDECQTKGRTGRESRVCRYLLLLLHLVRRGPVGRVGRVRVVDRRRIVRHDLAVF